MNGATINPWLHKEKQLKHWQITDRYMLGIERTNGLWSMMYLRRTELEYAKL